FSLGIGSDLTLTVGAAVITPGQSTLATIDTGTITIAPLNGLTATVNGLVIKQNGFTIDNATASLSDFSLGGLVSLAAPAVTFSKVSYVNAGSTSSLTGTLTFSADSAGLNLGGALTATISSSVSGSPA